MTTISGADLLRLHAEKSATIYNYPCWGVLHIMNVEEDWAA